MLKLKLIKKKNGVFFLLSNLQINKNHFSRKAKYNLITINNLELFYITYKIKFRQFYKFLRISKVL